MPGEAVHVEADRQAVLRQALDELSLLAGESDASRLATLADRLQAGRLRVLIAGEAKRGKSTVTNALIGRDVLPTGVTPLTAIATTVALGSDEHAMVTFTGGPPQRRPLADLPTFVTERGNPDNKLGVCDVTVFLDAPLLEQGVELVDTPGTGSVYEHNTQEAHRAYDTLDAAVLVLTADPPPSAAERDLLRAIAARSVATFVLLNKADNLDPDERSQSLGFAQQIVSDTAGHGVPVYAVSARAALNGWDTDAGFAEFTTAFTGYLRTHQASDLEQAVASHAHRIAGLMLDDVRLAQRASQLRTQQAAGRVEAFRDRLTTVSARRNDAADLTWAQQKRLMAALNDAATMASHHLAAQVADGLATFLDTDLAGAGTAELEQRGGDWLAGHARDAADAWRDEQRKMLEASLAEQDARLLAMLQAELAEVRQAAQELLELDLCLPDTAERLIPGRAFFYSGTGPAGQVDLLTGAVRRHLPGDLGRRRVRAHLTALASDQVPMLIGRARGDLQYRLEESIRLLIGALDQRYADSIGRLVHVIDAALTDSGQTDEQEEGRQRALATRADALTSVLNRIGGGTP